MRLSAALLISSLFAMSAWAHPIHQTKGDFEDKFRQLEELWPTPTETRLASGAPGPEYWQQKVDYDIEITLDEQRKTLSGQQTITYTNNSPHELSYLWMQLDQDRFRHDSMDHLTRTVAKPDGDTGRISEGALRRLTRMDEERHGYDLGTITLSDGTELDTFRQDTNLRIDLAEPLAPGETISFSMDFSFEMIEQGVVGGRSGYECFDADRPGVGGDCIYLAAQWFPRMHAYSDFEGWHNKAFLGRGEFTLEFGDYRVAVTVPADHIVSATGELTNGRDVLTAEQRRRMRLARRTTDQPVFIVTPEEALEAEQDAADGQQTWVYEATNVRDFAWASSRKFIWDAMTVEQPDGADVLAMSFYPNEAEPLWSAYSTKAVAHTIDVYSRFAFPYPYPTAQSVNGPVGGMEYPMITFNGPRPTIDADGNRTYSRRTKYGLITVIIHEIGHIYFPMIVNSDERQWTWMDEGINTFLQFVAEQEWEEDYPSRRGEPRDMIPYMLSERQVPIMTQSDSVLQFGANAYGKPATALVVLRETVMGREAFDFAFKTYAERWKFKRPEPYDFFRTMEEASGTDLDWFWRGWFYSTDHVDLALTSVVRAELEDDDPDERARQLRARAAMEPRSLSDERDAPLEKAVERDPSLLDFYNDNDAFEVSEGERARYRRMLEAREDERGEVLPGGTGLYYVTIENVGGLVSPVVLELTYENGRKETRRFPAEIFRRDAKEVTRLVTTPPGLRVEKVRLDPRWETGDADRSNNIARPDGDTVLLTVTERSPRLNLMQRLMRRVEAGSLAAMEAEPRQSNADQVAAAAQADAEEAQERAGLLSGRIEALRERLSAQEDELRQRAETIRTLQGRLAAEAEEAAERAEAQAERAARAERAEREEAARAARAAREARRAEEEAREAAEAAAAAEARRAERLEAARERAEARAAEREERARRAAEREAEAESEAAEEAEREARNSREDARLEAREARRAAAEAREKAESEVRARADSDAGRVEVDGEAERAAEARRAEQAARLEAARERAMARAEARAEARRAAEAERERQRDEAASEAEGRDAPARRATRPDAGPAAVIRPGSERDRSEDREDAASAESEAAEQPDVVIVIVPGDEPEEAASASPRRDRDDAEADSDPDPAAVFKNLFDAIGF